MADFGRTERLKRRRAQRILIRHGENMPRANNPDEELARWERACFSELIKHGGSEINLRELRQHFRKIREDQEAQAPESNTIPE